MVRGDQSSIYVGAFSSIGDRTVVQVRGCHRARCARRKFPTNPHSLMAPMPCPFGDAQSSAINPTGFSARTYIGDYVTIGQGCILRACTVDDNSIVGDGCIIQEVEHPFSLPPPFTFATVLGAAKKRPLPPSLPRRG